MLAVADCLELVCGGHTAGRALGLLAHADGFGLGESGMVCVWFVCDVENVDDW